MSGEVQNLSQQQSGEADEQSLLDEIVREGARRMLVAALETDPMTDTPTLSPRQRAAIAHLIQHPRAKQTETEAVGASTRTLRLWQAQEPYRQALDQATALTVRLLGRDVELRCACGLTVVQPLRASIAERCPRCWRRWRR